MTRPPDPLLRLRQLDPAPARPTPDRADGAFEERLTAELAGILVSPVTRTTRRSRRWRQQLHRHAGRLIAALVALVVVGTGVAYAVGLPHDVLAAFARDGQPTGAPVPWGAHDGTLAAALPLDRGRVLQVWTAPNDLNGTCDYLRLLTAAGIARNLGGGCQGGYPTDATPGVTPSPGSVVLLHLSMEVQDLYPDRVDDGPTFYFGQVFEPGITRVDLAVPGHPSIPFTLVSGGTWGVVKLPANPGAGEFDPTGVKVVLRDPHGTIRSTVDMATATATPCLFYRADRTIGSRGGCSTNP